MKTNFVDENAKTVVSSCFRKITEPTFSKDLPVAEEVRLGIVDAEPVQLSLFPELDADANADADAA